MLPDASTKILSPFLNLASETLLCVLVHLQSKILDCLHCFLVESQQLGATFSPFLSPHLGGLSSFVYASDVRTFSGNRDRRKWSRRETARQINRRKDGRGWQVGTKREGVTLSRGPRFPTCRNKSHRPCTYVHAYVYTHVGRVPDSIASYRGRAWRWLPRRW